MKRIFVIGTSSIPGEYIIPRLLSAIVARVPDIAAVDIANSLQIFDRAEGRVFHRRHRHEVRVS
jgi:hypothetical protein